MSLKRFGFFDEQPESHVVAELIASIRASPSEDEDKILNYLREGKQLLAIPGVVVDLLSETEGIIGPPHVFTDGEWAWTSDVLYYIERYHISIPSEFLARMKSLLFQCPTICNTEDLVRNNRHE
ncbi:MAG: hypothetical protein CMJ78_04885 [Planctomycetaceae bacterium]|nr:hypothetical protein [Planctomycetaceae bacterium]